MTAPVRIIGEANAQDRPLPAQNGPLCVALTLPYPPSGGHRLGMRQGIFFRTLDYKRWLAQVSAAAHIDRKSVV